MFPGFQERLAQEMRALAPATTTTTTIEVSGMPDRTLSAWIGGAIMASLPTFEAQCMARGDYEDVGPGIVHRTK